MAGDGCDEIVEGEVGFLFLEDVVHVCVLEHHLLPLFGEFLELLVHVLDAVEAVFEGGVLRDGLELLEVGQGGEEFLVVRLELERVGL